MDLAMKPRAPMASQAPGYASRGRVAMRGACRMAPRDTTRSFVTRLGARLRAQIATRTKYLSEVMRMMEAKTARIALLENYTPEQVARPARSSMCTGEAAAAKLHAALPLLLLQQLQLLPVRTRIGARREGAARRDATHPTDDWNGSHRRTGNAVDRLPETYHFRFQCSEAPARRVGSARVDP
jgi:hypothetical protein